VREYLPTAERVFREVFNDPKPTAVLDSVHADGDSVRVEGTATGVQITLCPSGGFDVSYAVLRSNYPHEPDDADVVETGPYPSFTQALAVAVDTEAIARYDGVMNKIAAEQQAREYREYQNPGPGFSTN
jgi:hypothetical protein